MRRFSLVLLCLGIARAATAPEVELDAVRKTRALLQAKLEEHDRDLRVRVRALYKLSRDGTAPMWVDPTAQGDVLHRRGAARRMIVRDLEERRELRDELARALVDEQRLLGELDRAPVTPPAAGSLLAPVRGRVLESFGVHADGFLRVSQRGVELAASPRETAVAPEAGTVAYAGPIRGLGLGVVLDHPGGFSTVIADLGRVDVVPNQPVSRGAPLGAPASDRVHLEVRSAGRPVDPAPLLRAGP